LAVCNSYTVAVKFKENEKREAVLEKQAQTQGEIDLMVILIISWQSRSWIITAAYVATNACISGASRGRVGYAGASSLSLGGPD
jgi:hypothetical protein